MMRWLVNLVTTSPPPSNNVYFCNSTGWGFDIPPKGFNCPRVPELWIEIKFTLFEIPTD